MPSHPDGREPADTMQTQTSSPVPTPDALTNGLNRIPASVVLAATRPGIAVGQPTSAAPTIVTG